MLNTATESVKEVVSVPASIKRKASAASSLVEGATCRFSVLGSIALSKIVGFWPGFERFFRSRMYSWQTCCQSQHLRALY